MTRATPHDPVFVKHHGPTVTDDWFRAQLFSRLVAQVDGLRTARPLWIDESSQRIGYEWLPALQPFIDRPTAALTDDLRRLGALLAALHAVAMPDELPARYPLAALGLDGSEVARLDAQLPCGMFWGDCWHGNIFRGEGAAIYVVDPLPNRWLFEPGWVRANGVIDIAMLHMSLFFCHPSTRLLTFDPRHYMAPAAALLEAYLGFHDAADLAPLVLRVSRTLAIRYIAAYRRRLAYPLARFKIWRSHRILRKLDSSLKWREP